MQFDAYTVPWRVTQEVSSGARPPPCYQGHTLGGGSGLRNMGVKIFKGLLPSGDGVPGVGGGVTLVYGSLRWGAQPVEGCIFLIPGACGGL